MATGMLIGLVLNELAPIFLHSNTNAFVVVYSSSVLPGMVPWFVILLSDLKFRRSNPDLLKQHPFKMPLFPFTNYFALFMLVVILGFMLINPETKVSVIVGLIVLAALTVIYGLRQFIKNARVNKVAESKN